MKASWSWNFCRDSPRQDNSATEDRPHAHVGCDAAHSLNRTGLSEAPNLEKMGRRRASGGGIKGKVTHVTIFSTYIRTDDGLVKIVPNDNIWKNVIINQTTGVVKAPPSGDAKPSEGNAEAT
jgi:Mechanosensitive ion channel